MQIEAFLIKCTTQLRDQQHLSYENFVFPYTLDSVESLGWKFVFSFQVEFEDTSVLSLDREEIYSLDEELPKRLRMRLVSWLSFPAYFELNKLKLARKLVWLLLRAIDATLTKQNTSRVQYFPPLTGHAWRTMVIFNNHFNRTSKQESKYCIYLIWMENKNPSKPWISREF